MKNQISLKTLTIGLLSTLAAPHAFAGGMDSGGGFAVNKSGQSILLDLAVANPEFKDQCVAHSSNNIRMGAAGHALGYEKITLKEIPVGHQARSLVKKWNTNSPHLVNLILQAMDSMEWRFSAYKVPEAQDAYVAPRSVGVPTPVAFYTKDLGVVVDTAAWNRLCETSKLALVIHESLRHVQLSYEQIPNTEKLQDLTATIVLSNPQEARTLESSRFLADALLDRIERQANSGNMSAPYNNRICRLLTKLQAEPTPKSSQSKSNLRTLQKQSCAMAFDLTTNESITDVVLMLNQVSFYARYETSQPETANEIMKLTSDLNETSLEILTNMFEANNAALVDVTRELNLVFFNVLEKDMIAYARNKAKGEKNREFSLRERQALERAIPQMNELLKNLSR